jgi:hypothetical protein
MDPWLERSPLWLDFHNTMTIAIRDALVPQVDPRYFVQVEARTTVLMASGQERLIRPDVTVTTGESRSGPRTAVPMAADQGTSIAEVTLPAEVIDEVEEMYLEVYSLPDHALVTVIELLSPTNKFTAEGRAEYLRKRREVLAARVNFVEIDLLRGGEPMPLKEPAPASDYRILVSHTPHRPRAQLHSFSYREPIPSLSVPLLPGDAEPVVDLSATLHAVIERARYYRVIDYTKPPVPPLRPEDEPWAAAIVARGSDAR